MFNVNDTFCAVCVCVHIAGIPIRVLCDCVRARIKAWNNKHPQKSQTMVYTCGVRADYIYKPIIVVATKHRKKRTYTNIRAPLQHNELKSKYIKAFKNRNKQMSLGYVRLGALLSSSPSQSASHPHELRNVFTNIRIVLYFSGIDRTGDLWVVYLIYCLSFGKYFHLRNLFEAPFLCAVQSSVEKHNRNKHAPAEYMLGTLLLLYYH